MKRGRKPGVRGPMHEGSSASRLSALEVGETLWRETTLETYSHDMRQMSVPRSRRPPELDGKEFIAGLFTAVSASKAGAVVYLIRLQRTT